ncbi:hypothetical protein DDE84_09420 [Bifidobacterium tibiigranuli]|uniref:CTP synthase n=1 Tax=Bifidobacterium tibiigranuli TaxID=2172043 RepID=A0A5N6S5B8_9BIFI|nr:hypothetical protein DDE84_09420 [Bifidobacterium tibiigranuli]KAE8129812.1 hypothetical protein DDF78_01665 [Bifidobacterium tibiigranuli]
MRRRLKTGELVSPHPALYAAPKEWQALNPVEQCMHMVRALALRHPNWVFAGPSAAAIWGLDHPWSMHDGSVAIISSTSSRHSAHRRLTYIYASSFDVHECRGLRVTSVARTIVDCALRRSLREGLPFIDSGLRAGLVTTADVLTECERLRESCAHIRGLVKHASPASENGGESFCRGTVIEEGFPVPELQVVLRDPDDPKAVCRVDYLYRLHDGRLIAIEYDGMRKYVDPSMTGNREIREVVRDEREREALLKRAGVTAIIRLDYTEVLQRMPLVRKLMAAGIPRLFRH